jgi:uncharacterized protein YoxC
MIVVPVLVQICVVIVTLGFVAIVASTILALKRLGEEAAHLTAAAHSSLAQVELIVQESQDLLAQLRELAPPTREVVRGLHRVGERATGISNAVLDELESPILTAVGLVRGVRTGAFRLRELLHRRFAPGSSPNNGDQDHE